MSLTVIFGGPLFEVTSGGKRVVVEVSKSSQRDNPLVKLFAGMQELDQMVIASASMGYTADFRRAAVDQVCAALEKEGVPFMRIDKGGIRPEKD